MSKHRIRNQNLNEIKYKIDVDNPYQKWVEEHGGFESVEANPDLLEDSPANKLWSDKTDTSLANILINRFLDETGNFPMLSPKENQVLKLYTAGKNEYQIANDLKIKRDTVRIYIERCAKKLKKLLNSVKGVEF